MLVKTLLVVGNKVTLLYLLVLGVCDAVRLYWIADLQAKEGKAVNRVTTLMTFVTTMLAVFAGVGGAGGSELFVVWVVCIGMVVVGTVFRVGVGIHCEMEFPKDCSKISNE